mmetsp:Transcript_52870/g.104318  ORF Transcript_52870/g.104318 Transcript_52870/m.104318 type:complete len:201 (+) Transcript_52870:19-621(+)
MGCQAVLRSAAKREGCINPRAGKATDVLATWEESASGLPSAFPSIVEVAPRARIVVGVAFVVPVLQPLHRAVLLRVFPIEPKLVRRQPAEPPRLRHGLPLLAVAPGLLVLLVNPKRPLVLPGVVRLPRLQRPQWDLDLLLQAWLFVHQEVADIGEHATNVATKAPDGLDIPCLRAAGVLSTSQSWGCMHGCQKSRRQRPE